MGEAIGEVLTPAIGVALSPIPIVAVILMLFSPRARTNGPAFLGGWVAGLMLVTGATMLLASPDDVSGDGDDPATWASLITLLLGVLLLLMAVQNWKKRPAEGVIPDLPKWMQSIDSVTPLFALGMGAFLSGINPKNLIFDIAAGTTIAAADLSFAESLVPLLVFVIVASVSVAVPVVWYVLDQERASKTLEGWKSWLQINNALVMAILFLVLGVKFFGKGLGGLID